MTENFLLAPRTYRTVPRISSPNVCLINDRMMRSRPRREAVQEIPAILLERRAYTCSQPWEQHKPMQCARIRELASPRAKATRSDIRLSFFFTICLLQISLRANGRVPVLMPSSPQGLVRATFDQRFLAKPPQDIRTSRYFRTRG